MDRVAILSAAEQDFQPLVGIRERQDFEAKQKWPDLTSPVGRWEFAKDVAGMANGGGGVIVFGVETQSIPSAQADVTVSVTPIDPMSVDLGAAHGILADRVLPRLRDVQIEFVPGLTIAPHGIVLLYAPPQDTKVILCKAIEESLPLKEYLFGFAERDRDGTRNWSRDGVAKMLRTGTSESSARLESIERTLGAILEKIASGAGANPSPNDNLEARINEVLGDE